MSFYCLAMRDRNFRKLEVTNVHHSMAIVYNKKAKNGFMKMNWRLLDGDQH